MLWQRTEDCVGMRRWQWQYLLTIPTMCWPSGQTEDTSSCLLIGQNFTHPSSDWPAAHLEVTLGHGALDMWPGAWCCHWQQPGMQHCTETTSSQASHDDILQTLTTLQTSSPLVSSWHQGLKSIIHHSSAGSGFIGRSLAHWHQFLPAPIIRSIKMFKARSKARDRVWLKWSVLRQLTQKPHLTSSSPSLFGHDTFFHLYQTKISK